MGVTMLKPITMQRVQAAMGVATQALVGYAAKSSSGQAPTAPDAGNVIALAALLLEEDDRQERTIIIPGKA